MDWSNGKTRYTILVFLVTFTLISLFVIRAFALDPTLEERLSLADQKYISGLYENATIDYLEILEDTPNPTEAETVAYLVRMVPVSMVMKLSEAERTAVMNGYLGAAASPGGHYLSGLAYMQFYADYDSALQEFDLAISGNPTNDVKMLSYEGKALCYEKTGNVSSAAAAMNEAIAVDTSSERATSLLRKLRDMLRRTGADSEFIFTNPLVEQMASASAYVTLVYSVKDNLILGDLASAIDAIETTVGAHGVGETSLSALRLLYEVGAQKRCPELVVPACERMLAPYAGQPENRLTAGLRNVMAEAKEMQLNHAAAELDWEAFAAAEPAIADPNLEEVALFCEAKMREGLNLMDQRRYAEAKAVYDELLARYPNSYYGSLASQNSNDIQAYYLQ
jgi:tetratricopeptide (TPR) repeat protein